MWRAPLSVWEVPLVTSVLCPELIARMSQLLREGPVLSVPQKSPLSSIIAPHSSRACCSWHQVLRSPLVFSSLCVVGKQTAPTATRSPGPGGLRLFVSLGVFGYFGSPQTRSGSLNVRKNKIITTLLQWLKIFWYLHFIHILSDWNSGVGENSRTIVPYLNVQVLHISLHLKHGCDYDRCHSVTPASYLAKIGGVGRWDP